MELTLQQISAMLDDSYIYVDVRSEIAYQHGHIANAVHGTVLTISLFLKTRELLFIVPMVKIVFLWLES